MMTPSEKMRLVLNGWGENGHGPVTITCANEGLAVYPYKPGTEPLTFTEADEEEFKAIKDAYLERVPTPAFREEGPLSHVGDNEEPDVFPEDGDLIVGDMAYDDDE